MKCNMCRWRAALGYLSLCALALSSASAGDAGTLNVQTRNAALRSSPSYLASVVADLQYGETVSVAEKNDSWCKVSSSAGKTGWIHESALTTKTIKIAAAGKNADIAASSGEMALAGKGFSAQVEAEFKKNNKDIDFTWVDKMENMKVEPKQMASFLNSGDLAVAGKESGK